MAFTERKMYKFFLCCNTEKLSDFCIVNSFNTFILFHPQRITLFLVVYKFIHILNTISLFCYITLKDSMSIQILFLWNLLVIYNLQASDRRNIIFQFLYFFKKMLSSQCMDKFKISVSIKFYILRYEHLQMTV